MATRGYGNSGEIPQQPSSIENNPRGNREESRSSSESRQSRAMGEGSQGLEAGSRRTIQLHKAKAYITTAETNRIHRLEKKGQEHSTLKYLLNRQNLESAIKDSLKGIENAKNTIQLTNHAKTLDKTLIAFKKICPNDFNDKEIKELIKMAEEKLAPIKEKYLPKSKSKSNDDFGIGM